MLLAIANAQLDGFPARDELNSVVVEHDIDVEYVGVQDACFPTLIVDKHGWWWVILSRIHEGNASLMNETMASLLALSLD